jgi:hypothetical protein
MRIRFTKKISIICELLFLLIVMWFSWMSFESNRTAKIEDRIKSLLNAGLQIAAMDTPRVKVTNDGGYYGPDLNNSSFIKDVYPRVYTAILEGLQDSTTPYSKVENIRMDTDYVSELHAYANVSFEVFPGLTKTISVTASIKAPKFKDLTGLDEIGS